MYQGANLDIVKSLWTSNQKADLNGTDGKTVNIQSKAGLFQWNATIISNNVAKTVNFGGALTNDASDLIANQPGGEDSNSPLIMHFNIGNGSSIAWDPELVINEAIASGVTSDALSSRLTSSLWTSLLVSFFVIFLL